MNIKTEKVLKNYEQERKVALYSVQDIKDLIIKDLQDKGFATEQITFDVDYKYISDEWGMNRTPTTVFNGAKVVVQQK